MSNLYSSQQGFNLISQGKVTQTVTVGSTYYQAVGNIPLPKLTNKSLYVELWTTSPAGFGRCRLKSGTNIIIAGAGSGENGEFVKTIFISKPSDTTKTLVKDITGNWTELAFDLSNNTTGSIEVTADTSVNVDLRYNIYTVG